MTHLVRRTAQVSVLLAASLGLAGCAGSSLLGTRANVPVSILGQGANSTPPANTNASTTVAKVKPTATFSTATILKFINPSARGKLSEPEKVKAAEAQFFALQFGRPGVPRRWSGADGTKGAVTVGPFVTVNDLQCRDFSHEVAVAGTNYPATGTACREGAAQWQVVNFSTT